MSWLSASLEAILAGLTERYATQQNESGSGALRVIVGPIVDSVQYAEVLRYLQELSMVESLSVVSARQRDIEFELIISGGGFEDVIGLGDLLSVDQTLSGRTTLPAVKSVNLSLIPNLLTRRTECWPSHPWYCC